MEIPSRSEREFISLSPTATITSHGRMPFADALANWSTSQTSTPLWPAVANADISPSVSMFLIFISKRVIMFDLAVIGLGPAGLEVVDIAIKSNLKVI